MLPFIFEIAVFAGLAGVIVIALRALPRVSDEVFAESRSRIRTHELTLLLESADEMLKANFEKFLRKMKIVILKADNAVTEKIAKVTDNRTKEKTSFVIPQAKEEKELPKFTITEEGRSNHVSTDSTGDSSNPNNEATLTSMNASLEEKPMDILMPKKSISIKNSGETKRGRKKKTEA